MKSVLQIVLAIWILGIFVSIEVYTKRAFGNFRIAALAIRFEPSQRAQAIAWFSTNFVNALLWPIVLVLWIIADRPPHPVLYGRNAARELGLDVNDVFNTEYHVRPRWQLLDLARASIESRRGSPGAVPIVGSAQLDRLPAIGRTVYRDGQVQDVTDFYLPAFLAAGSPSPGSSEWDAFTDQFLDELSRAPENWGQAGAFYVAVDFVAPEDRSKPRFVKIMDPALYFMAGEGVAGTSLPTFAHERWNSVLGPAS